MIPCDSEYSLIFRNSNMSRYIRKVFMVICTICMCSNGTIVTDIFVGTVYLAIVVYCVSCVIDSIGLPCAFGLVIFWYTSADSWRCRKYHIANGKLSVQFDSVQKTESYTVYIRCKSYQFESIIYVSFSWYHFACAHCIVLMWHLNY